MPTKVAVGTELTPETLEYQTFGAYLTEAPHPAASYFGTGECFLWRASLHAPLPPPPSADTTNLNMRSTTVTEPHHDDRGRSRNDETDAQDLLSQDHTLSPPANGASRRASSLSPAPSVASSSPLPPPSIRFQNFAYSGANDYCMFCETGFLSVGGGGGGRFGLWLNDSLSRGHSAPCDTFANQALSDEGEKFDVLGVELWVVGDTGS